MIVWVVSLMRVPVLFRWTSRWAPTAGGRERPSSHSTDDVPNVARWGGSDGGAGHAHEGPGQLVHQLAGEDALATHPGRRLLAGPAVELDGPQRGVEGVRAPGQQAGQRAGEHVPRAGGA